MTDYNPKRALLVFLFLVGWGAFFTLFGCSSGPQTPFTTPVVNVTCSWSGSACQRLVVDGGPTASRDLTLGSACDCLIDRSAAEATPTTTGNEVRDNTTTPEIDVGL